LTIGLGHIELGPEDFPTIDAIRGRWATDETERRAWIGSLTDADVGGPCFAETKGSHLFWFQPQHLYTCGMQQFSDAAGLLSRAGRLPGEINFLEFGETRATGREYPSGSVHPPHDSGMPDLERDAWT